MDPVLHQSRLLLMAAALMLLFIVGAAYYLAFCWIISFVLRAIATMLGLY